MTLDFLGRFLSALTFCANAALKLARTSKGRFLFFGGKGAWHALTREQEERGAAGERLVRKITYPSHLAE